jgi:hypothetical protein
MRWAARVVLALCIVAVCALCIAGGRAGIARDSTAAAAKADAVARAAVEAARAARQVMSVPGAMSDASVPACDLDDSVLTRQATRNASIARLSAARVSLEAALNAALTQRTAAFAESTVQLGYPISNISEAPVPLPRAVRLIAAELDRLAGQAQGAAGVAPITAVAPAPHALIPAMLRLLPKSLPSTLAQPPGSPHVPLLSVFAALILAALAAFAWGIRDPRDGLAVCGG